MPVARDGDFGSAPPAHCAGRHDDLTNRAGPLSYYDEEDTERYLRDATEALDLPAWARVRLSEDGGPGTGFTAVSIWVDDGHSLADMSRWLHGARGGRADAAANDS